MMTLQDGAKKFDKQTPGATVMFAQGKSATDDAGEIAAGAQPPRGRPTAMGLSPDGPGQQQAGRSPSQN